MRNQNPNPDKDETRLSLEQIWRVGCSEGALSDHDWGHFVRLSRNRFYTLILGLKHARETNQPSEHLEKGFVTELLAAPGLEKLWLGSEFKNDAMHRKLRRRKFNSKFKFV